MKSVLTLSQFCTRHFSCDYAQDRQIVRAISSKLWVFALILLLSCFPLVVDRYTSYIAALALAAVIGSVGLNILTGYAGQISIGHGAFVAIGAYSYAILLAKTHLPFWICIPVAGLISGTFGIVIGLPALRMRGLYLAMATVAFHLIIDQVVMFWETLTGGYQGLDVTTATVGPYEIRTEACIYYLILFITVLLVIFAVDLTRSKIGRAFCAIRDRDIAAEAIGISVVRYKLFAFFISSVYAGIAGALTAISLGRISPYDFSFIVSVAYISMIILGGLGSILGSVLGGIAVTLLPFGLSAASDFLQPYYPPITTKFGDVKTLAYGLIVIAVLIWEPEGLAGYWKKARSYFKEWPFTY